MVTLMMPARDDALRLLRERFFNRTDRVAILAPWGKPCPVEANGTLDELLLGHLLGDAAPETKVRYENRRGSGAMMGRFRVGSYCPAPDATTRWLCIDFDGAGHAGALADPQAAALASFAAFRRAGLPAYLERSGGGKGWHLWCFFNSPVAAAKAQALGRALAPKDAPLDDGGVADPRAGRGIEVFPKQAKIRSKGFGNLVWLPWWCGAAGGGNRFYRLAEGNELEPFAPEGFEAAHLEAVERILATLREKEKPVAAPVPAAAPTVTEGAWAEWRQRALAAVPLEAIYGAWLTGKAAGAGWLECRDPASPSGDQNPSASVADGAGDAERGSFHSFISGETQSVFDFLVEHGGAADFRAARARVAELSGVPEPQPTQAAPSSPTRSSNPRRPEIQINGRPFDSILADAWRATLAANRTQPALFLRDGALVRLGLGATGRRIEPMAEMSVFSHLADVALWVKVTEDLTVYTSPSKDVARAMLDKPDPGLPWLDAIVTTPVFAPDGSLVCAPGYHARARVWYEPPSRLRIPPVSARPSADDVAAACALLCDELLADFPFVDDSSRAHMVSALLLPFARRLIQGPTPIHLFEAPTEGSGKGLMVNLVALLATGSPAAGGSLPENEDEVRKKIGSERCTGRPLLVLDNADNKKRVDSSALASATTMWPVWTDRLLGHIKMFSAPNEAVWILTANNPRLSRELARRCVSVRIDPRVDRPWLREQTAFRYPDLLDWACTERPRLIHAALVLIQSWIAKGRPPGKTRLGTFERWSETLGGILAAVGIDGFLGNLDALYETADAEGTMWREFIAAWWEAHQDSRVRVSELVELCASGEFMSPVLGDGSERSQSTRLGKALQNARDRVFARWRVESAGRDRGSKRPVYRLAPAGEGQQELFIQENGDVGEP